MEAAKCHENNAWHGKMRANLGLPFYRAALERAEGHFDPLRWVTERAERHFDPLR